MKIPEIKKYIEIYGEGYLFNVIGPLAKKKGYLSFDDFYEICMWKSARQKQRYIQNRDTIEEISKRAFAGRDERRKMEILSSELEGVGIPTASALLTVVYPKEYAIIDIRCLETLREKYNFPISKSVSIDTWKKYLDTMREWAKENNVTPRELDMAFFSIHKENLNKQSYRNLYKKF